jgi:hypothetical protein
MMAPGALQSALYAALNGSIGMSVYDEVPPGTAMPYVTIGEGTERPWDTMSDSGSEETVWVQIWSEAKGFKQINTTAAAIDAVLHDAALTVTGATMVSMRREFFEKFTEAGDAGEMWRRGVMRYRATITE